jgi:hypothetical protein
MSSELRNDNLLPIIFDFEPSLIRDFTETIKIIAAIQLKFCFFACHYRPKLILIVLAKINVLLFSVPLVFQPT